MGIGIRGIWDVKLGTDFILLFLIWYYAHIVKVYIQVVGEQ